MAGEIQVRLSVTVNKSPLYYQSRPNVFTEDMATARRESMPFSADVDGAVIAFSHLSRPGRIVVYNFSTTQFITLGAYDGISFLPLLEILPEKFESMRLSRYLNQEFTPGTGTGTGSDVNQFMIKTSSGTADGVIDAFEAE